MNAMHSRNRRSLYFPGLALLAALLLAQACAAPAAVDLETRTVTLALSEEPPQLDSTRTTDAISGQVLGHVMEGLLRYDADNQLVGGVAERWETSDDGRTVTFGLRRDARWSDGSSVTARDFIFAWRTILDPDTDARYAFLLYDILHAREIRAGDMPSDALGVSAPDPHTLAVTLKQPAPRFLALTAFFTFLPINQSFYEHASRYGADADQLLYNGPFVISHWEHDVSLRLERNPHYPAPPTPTDPGLRRVERIHYDYFADSPDVVFNLYENGNVAMAGLSADTLPEALRRGWSVQQADDGALFYLEFNHRPARATANRDLRKAIHLATDPDELTNAVIRLPGNRPGVSLFPRWLRGVHDSFRAEYPPPPHAVDDNAARDHLNAALRQLETSASELELTLLADDNPLTRIQAEYLQETFRGKLGIEIRIDAQSFRQRLAKMHSGDFDIVFAGWGPDYDDPLTFGDLFHSANANNNGRYRDESYDEHVRIAQTALDRTTRMQAFSEIQRIVHEDAVIVPLFERAAIYVQHPRLAGVARRVVGTNPDYRNAWITRAPD